MDEPQISEQSKQSSQAAVSLIEEAADHDSKVEEYIQNCLFRGCNPQSTVPARAAVLKSIFRRVVIEDERCPGGKRHLFVWELLNPKAGPGYLSEIIASLLAADLAPGTRRRYMNDALGLCEYVIAKPNIPGKPEVTLSDKYGPIRLTFTKYDLPIHAADKAVRKRYALSVPIKTDFIEFLRTQYLPSHPLPHIGARDYAVIVLQVEIGARASEVLGIRVSGTSCDIDRTKDRIRLLGKGSAYSGKRPRWVRLSPLAAKVLYTFEKVFRPMFPKSSHNDVLFLNQSGGRMTGKEYWKAFRKIINLANAAGVLVPEDLVPHDLRRTYATNALAENPLSYRKVLKQLGHIYPSSVAPYLICTDDEVAEEQDDLMDIFINPNIDRVS
jgi:integrase